MNRPKQQLWWRLASGCLLTAIACCLPGHAQVLSILPAPLSVSPVTGSLPVEDGAVIAYPAADPGAQFAAEHFVSLLQRTRGLRLIARPMPPGKPSHALIVMSLAASASADSASESYDLTVSPTAVRLTAPTDAGLYYATITLWQLLTSGASSHGPALLQCVQVHDAPQLAWRGLMLDSSRHMQSVEFIRQLIDWMSLEKLNVLHWHLTDDQGWRLEIKRYPKLTSVGAWRELASTSNNPSAAELKSHRYGGYYSQDQVRSLVAYASRHHVMIVPEIEMPGHASAALAAYPQFGSTDKPLRQTPSNYGVFPNLYNVDDATFTFLENILTEVLQLFPSPYIHVGGDEAIKNQWKASQHIQAQMKQLGISDEDALQSYFMKRIDTFLTAHGRRTLGWEEILQGGLAQNAAVMSWHGVKGGIDAAKLGHDAVLTPSLPLYFNSRQSDAADEAPGRASLNTLASVYAFDPAPSTLTSDERKHILGVQANLWTEYVISTNRDEWMLYPRTAALAELGWSAPAQRNWNSFLTRLTVEMQRYRALGIGFDPIAFRPRTTETLSPEGTNVNVALHDETNFGTLRYTTDGTSVTASSPKYVSPMNLSLPTHLHAATFLEDSEIPGSDLDRTLDALTVRKRFSQELKLCVNAAVVLMEPDPPQGDRPVALANYRNPCWTYKAANLNGLKGLSVGVFPLAYVFNDLTPPAALPSVKSANGEVEVYQDTCSGKLLATLPLQPAVGHQAVTTLRAGLPQTDGTHDLCIKIARPTTNPLWALDWVQLEPQ